MGGGGEGTMLQSELRRNGSLSVQGVPLVPCKTSIQIKVQIVFYIDFAKYHFF